MFAASTVTDRNRQYNGRNEHFCAISSLVEQAYQLEMGVESVGTALETAHFDPIPTSTQQSPRNVSAFLNLLPHNRKSSDNL
jgi:hypothetical protein